MMLDRVGVVGCGLMGAGIAEVTARSGRDVVVYEVDAAAGERGELRVRTSLANAVRRGKVTEADEAETLGRLRFTTVFEDLSDRTRVIEAVPEVEAMKIATFSALDEVVADRDAILASNTSSIPIMKLAMATSRPENVIGLHFFNPVPVLPLVELVTSLLTADAVTRASAEFAQMALGKHVIRCQDRAGFIVNALLIPYVLSAVRMLESGFATAEHIDEGMVKGCAHPMGPLALTDLIGLDTTIAISESMYEEFKEPLYAPPPLLSRMVEAGLLGRKTGRGFYDYTA